MVLVSVIIPVFNVEKYLAKCIDSVLAQTYKDLDIILVDDGSTDSSAEICRRYVEKDKRIRLFHTRNGGLSAARGLALDNLLPQSEWIAFIDSDDYIEPEMIGNLLRDGGGSCIIECGIVNEYKNKQVVESPKAGTYATQEAFVMLLNGKIRNYAWDKLYRRELFQHIHFPLGRNYEDVSVQHYLVAASKSVTIVDGDYYHYLRRTGSITGQHRLKTLFDRWIAYFERYEYCMGISYLARDEATRTILLRALSGCAEAIWEWYYHNPKEERARVKPLLRGISRFYRKHMPLFGFSGMSAGERFIGVLIRSDSRASLMTAYCVFHLYMKLFHKNKDDLSQLFD
ncbi:MAG: glycosyltransferase family 2 protein [Ruminococcus sp.]|nr:glycosyltransferase family 2 protein [Ruminococcus sp.]